MSAINDSGRTASAPPSLWRRLQHLLPYFRGSLWVLPIILLAVTLSSLTEPVVPALMKPLLDNGFSGRGTIQLWLVPIAIIGLFALRGASGFVARYGLAWMANHALVRLRHALFETLMRASPGFYAGATASALSNTVVYEVQLGTRMLVDSLLAAVRDTLTLAALLGYLFFINWKLTLVVLVMFPGVALVMRIFSRRLHRLTRTTQEATDNLAYVVEENVLAHRLVRIHAAEQSQALRFEDLSRRMRSLAMRATIADSLMTPLTQILAAAALSAVICIALWQSATSGFTVGGFAAFVTAMLMVITPVKHLSEAAMPITRGLAAIERGLELIESARPQEHGQHAVARAVGALSFEQVTVRYPGASAPALDRFDLTVRAGELVALVGRSGAGKSTVANLLPRFVDPSSGEVMLDGVPLRDWDLAALRRQFALVSQDVILFNDTIAANVALGDLSPDPGRVRRALEAAQLADFVAALPDGVQTVIGHNGSQLSGGQRQRLAIARALYKDAPVLILDEATSALDTAAERAVQEALDRLLVGRTALVVAHRLSTIERADRIVVMEAGRVVEQGTHRELLERGGAYARLHQFGGEAATDPLQTPGV